MHKFVPGLLLACGAVAVHAAPKTIVEPASAAAAPSTLPATKLDLTLPAAEAAAVVDPLQAAPLPVRQVAEWITGSGDNTRLPYLIIDKPTARVYAFGPGGEFQGDAPALLGMGVGDVMLAPSATMSQMPPKTRITPAGRFVSKLAVDKKGKELLVLDYKAAFSLHPVVKGQPWENRAGRLSSATPQDNRISFGCINVPVPFYQSVINRAFANTHGIVYILPETSQATAYFKFEPKGVTVPVEALAAAPSAVPPTATPTSTDPAAKAVPEAAAK